LLAVLEAERIVAAAAVLAVRLREVKHLTLELHEPLLLAVLVLVLLLIIQVVLVQAVH
jgi:hypothetical protein